MTIESLTAKGALRGVARTLRRNSTVLGAFGMAVLIFVVATAYAPGFASGFHLKNLFIFASFTGFAAIGQTIVIIGGGIDLSVPWIMAFGGIMLVTLNDSMPFWLAVVVVIGLGLLLGAVNGVFVTILAAPPLIVTLGVGGLIEGYLLSVTTNQGGAGTVPPPAVALSNGHIGPVPIIPVVWLVLAVAVTVVMRRTPLGRRVYAVGANPVAARLAGVRIARVRLATYVISGGASALSGVLFAGYVRSVFMDMGQDYLFGGIAAVALGGVALLGGSGSYWGTFAGALTLAFLSAFLPMLGLDDASVKVGYGIVILIGIYLARLLEQASAREGGRRTTKRLGGVAS